MKYINTCPAFRTALDSYWQLSLTELWLHHPVCGSLTSVLANLSKVSQPFQVTEKGHLLLVSESRRGSFAPMPGVEERDECGVSHQERRVTEASVRLAMRTETMGWAHSERLSVPLSECYTLKVLRTHGTMGSGIISGINNYSLYIYGTPEELQLWLPVVMLPD